ncbi:hypothetical protein [Natrinema gelatinilyticum]|uniref:hypothetical protein n=1 Tax=Natrinema gelatinilyticum TaxID=2961571 RepID=UPI0020C34EBD|nr:hypothetical protein [Natrinema gelatinilyticum]
MARRILIELPRGRRARRSSYLGVFSKSRSVYRHTAGYGSRGAVSGQGQNESAELVSVTFFRYSSSVSGSSELTRPEPLERE